MSAPAPQPQQSIPPQLARLRDKHLRQGDEIRYIDPTQLVIYHKNKPGCGTLIFVLLLAAITLGIALIFGLWALLAPGGYTITYTVKPNGKIKKKQRAA